MNRKPNELLLAPVVLAGRFAAGSSHGYSVEDGPRQGARIVGVRLEDDVVVLEYDQPVNEVLARNSFGGVEFRSVQKTPAGA